ncbi:hypothetical protein E2R67_09570 [Psychromonas sp. RZ5]|nr:hypothetical protein E2R67_09570 [Psychromonas sp. RZ5]
MNQQTAVSATEWKHMCFAGISKHSINEIDLNEEQIAGLLSMIDLSSVISSGTAIELQHLINEQGTTAWAAMYALVIANDKEALNLIANGKTRIHIPANFIRSVFGNHINWPAAILEKYDLTLGEYRPFAIPFLVHKSVTNIGALSQSLKAPDGSLEIFGVYEFLDTDPEGLLKEYAELATFIKEEREDAIQ